MSVGIGPRELRWNYVLERVVVVLSNVCTHGMGWSILVEQLKEKKN